MQRILCKIKGHSFTSIKKGHVQIEEFQCVRCKQKYTTDGYGQIVKLTKYWEKNNQLFEQYFRKNVIS